MSQMTRRVGTYSDENRDHELMETLFDKLNQAIDDMEQGRVQTIDEAWEEIDAV